MTFLTLLQSAGGAPPAATVAYIKVSGAWQQATVYLKVGGVWQVTTSFIKVSGAWE
jgi:hypothetical protein